MVLGGSSRFAGVTSVEKGKHKKASCYTNGKPASMVIACVPPRYVCLCIQQQAWLFAIRDDVIKGTTGSWTKAFMTIKKSNSAAKLRDGY